MYDYSKLAGRIVEKCGNRKIFADRITLSQRSVSLKMNQKIPWTQDEMERAMFILNFDKGEIGDYFFTHKVPNVGQENVYNGTEATD